MSMLPQIKTKGSLTEKAYETLKRAILDFDLKPGQLLTEEELSTQLGISRTPLRAALNKLTYENLITVIPGRGTFVSELNPDYMEDIFVVRETMEALCVKLAAKSRTESNIKEMEDIIEEQSSLLDEKDFDAKHSIKLDVRFHYAIAKATKNEILKEQTLQLGQGYCRYIIAVPFQDKARKIVEEHRMILEAIKKGAGEEGAKIAQAHINDIKQRIVERL